MAGFGIKWKGSGVSKRMTKAALVAEIAEKAKVNKAQASRVLKELAEIACREAVNGFIVPGICKLSVVERKERRCRIPSTGQLVLIGAHKALKTVPLGAAKNRISPRSERSITVIADEPKTESAAAAAAGAGAPPAATSAPQIPDSGNISFMCSECGAMISAPPSSAGQQGECPFCNATIKIPEKGDAEEITSSGPQQASVPSGDFILFACDDCGQEIECSSSMCGLSASCPACGSQVTIPMSSTVAPPQPDGSSLTASTGSSDNAH